MPLQVKGSELESQSYLFTKKHHSLLFLIFFLILAWLRNKKIPREH